MKLSFLSKNFITIILLCISIIFFLSSCIEVFGMTHYQETDFVTGIVTASNLNIRSGPGTGFKIVSTVKKNEYIRIFAKIGSWYVVQTDDDIVGTASSKYIKPIYPSASSGSSSNTNNLQTDINTNNYSVDELEVLNLINAKRKENGLSTLKFDDELQNVARIKAQDMVDNNYFSHTSPIYGSPFNMISSFKISYKTAGENIAGNSTNSGAIEAWMNSSGHKDNILNSNFNYTGIGVVNSPKYGKIFVQMFIGK